MTSNEKRREMARSLRRVDVFVDPMDDAEICDRREVEHALGLVNEDDWYRACDVHYLADLIESEPERTCHMVWVSDRDGYECTACGDVFTDDPDDDGRVSAYAASTFSYCPHCGSMVVDGNE